MRVDAHTNARVHAHAYRHSLVFAIFNVLSVAQHQVPHKLQNIPSMYVCMYACMHKFCVYACIMRKCVCIHT
jgi:hypothetical protein